MYIYIYRERERERERERVVMKIVSMASGFIIIIIIIVIMIIIVIIIIIFLTQSNTGFDFLLWPSNLRIVPFMRQATELKIVLQGIVSRMTREMVPFPYVNVIHKLNPGEVSVN